MGIHRFLISIFFLIIIGGQATAATMVNLDAKNSFWTTISLDAGSYTVTPFDNSSAGGYTAWSAWDRDGSDINQGRGAWLNNYTVKIGSLQWPTYSDPYYFATKAEAFAAAVSTSFTLDTAGDVSFILEQKDWSDNREGMSLRVELAGTSPVPEPTTFLMFGLGLLGISGVGRRKK